jgi:toxin-antitoxin system PIN domain toxin
VKLPDVNLLIYAADELSPHYSGARSWLTQVLSGTEQVGFAWLALLGFVRISTNAAAFDEPLPVPKAFAYVDSWLGSPVATVVRPTHEHASVLRRLLEPLGTAGNLTADAHLAALAIEHGAELCSRDVDFSRFSGVRWTDPLR